jgi:hypothetical protein
MALAVGGFRGGASRSARRPPRRHPAALTALVGAVWVVACRAPTQVKLEISTDAECADVTGTTITTGLLRDLEERPPTTETRACSAGRIGSLVLVPRDEKDSEFAVRVVTGFYKTPEECVTDGYLGGCIVARRALSFLPHDTIELPIEMEAACIDVPCEATQTCRHGVCVSAVLDDPRACTDPAGCDGARGGAGPGATSELGGDGAASGAGGDAPALVVGGAGAGGTVPTSGGDGLAGAGGVTDGGEPGGAGAAGEGQGGGAGRGGEGGGAGSGLGGLPGTGGLVAPGGAPGMGGGSPTGAAPGAGGTLGSGGAPDAGGAGAASVAGAAGVAGQASAAGSAGLPNVAGAAGLPSTAGTAGLAASAGAAGRGGGGTGGAAATHTLVVTTGVDQLDGDVASIDALLADPGSDGAVSLREAITACNATTNEGGPDVIEFDLAGAPPYVVALTGSALPPITDAVFLDGHSQPDAVAGPVIALDGAGLSVATDDGLYLAAGSDGSTVRGLAIYGFPNNGILIQGSGAHTLQNCTIGLMADGITKSANGRHGISVQDSAANVIGGQAAPAARERNVVSGNAVHGIVLNGPGSAGNVVYGNVVGLDANQTVRRSNDNGLHLSNGASGNQIGGSAAYANVFSGNRQNGIRIIDDGTQDNVVQSNYVGTDAAFSTNSGLGNLWAAILVGTGADDNVIGGAGIGEGNWIRYNGDVAIGVAGGTNPTLRNALLGNHVFDNGSALGIDLGNDDLPGPNDAGDGDAGPNDLLNFPVLGGSSCASGTATVDFLLDVPAGDYRIELFASATVNPTGYGNGETLVHVEDVTHGGIGAEPFVAQFPCVTGQHLTATATEVSGSGYGATSEFSLAIPSD